MAKIEERMERNVRVIKHLSNTLRELGVGKSILDHCTHVSDIRYFCDDILDCIPKMYKQIDEENNNGGKN